MAESLASTSDFAHPGVLEELDRDTCLELLRGAEVGRLGWTHDGRVMIFPLNCALDGEDILVRTPSEEILSAVRSHGYVSFQADEIEPAVRAGWSVLVTGQAEVITAGAELERLAALVTPWRGTNGVSLIRLRPSSIAGRRLKLRPGHVQTVFLEASDDDE